MKLSIPSKEPLLYPPLLRPPLALCLPHICNPPPPKKEPPYSVGLLREAKLLIKVPLVRSNSEKNSHYLFLYVSRQSALQSYT